MEHFAKIVNGYKYFRKSYDYFRDISFLPSLLYEINIFGALRFTYTLSIQSLFKDKCL